MPLSKALNRCAVASLPLLTACGFFMTQAPPSDHANLTYFNCTESAAGPVGDLLWGGLNLLGALAAEDNYYQDADQVRTVGFAWAVFSGASAISGFNKVQKCHEAKRQLAERMQRAPGTTEAGMVTPGSGALVAAVTLSPAVDTLRVGEARRLVAAAFASSGLPAGDRLFTWSSSNDAIASVDAAGLVTARAAGSIVVAARTGMAVGTATIVVVP